MLCFKSNKSHLHRYFLIGDYQTESDITPAPAYWEPIRKDRSVWITLIRYTRTRTIATCNTGRPLEFLISKDILWIFLGHLFTGIRDLCDEYAPVLNSPPGEIGGHFADDVFWCIFLNEIFCILLKIHWSLFLRVQFTITRHWFR